MNSTLAFDISSSYFSISLNLESYWLLLHTLHYIEEKRSNIVVGIKVVEVNFIAFWYEVKASSVS